MPNFQFDPNRPVEKCIVLNETAEPQVGLVKAWSHSRLKNYEQCPHRIFLSSVEKHKEEQHPAAVRGQAIHDAAENFVTGNGPFDPALKKYKPEFERLKREYAEEKNIVVEQEWGFDVDWEPCEYHGKNVWLRAKLDLYQQIDPISAYAIDYKTGRKEGNALAHISQGRDYAIAAFMRYPELQHFIIEFWYLDLSPESILKKKYTRAQAMLFLPKLNIRAHKLTSDCEFTPKPSKPNCRWCPHRASGVCDWSIE